MVARSVDICKFLADPDLRQTFAVGVIDGMRSGLGLPKTMPAAGAKNVGGAKPTGKKTLQSENLRPPHAKPPRKTPDHPQNVRHPMDDFDLPTKGPEL